MKKIIEKYNNMPLIVKASFWFLICSFVQKGISVIITPIFTRLLSPEEYGNFNVFTSWESVLNIFVSLCLSAGVYQQGLVKYEKDIKKFSSSMQGLTLIIVIIWCSIYLIFRNIINKFLGFSTIYMISMIFIIWTNNVFAFWASEQKVNFKYKSLILITILTSIFNPLLGIILIHFMDDNVLARILGMVFVALIFYVVLFIKQVRAGKVLYDKQYWKYAIMYNIPLIPHYLSETVLASSDRIMIERLIDSRTAGIYSLAYSIALIMTLFNTSLMQTISPWIYKKIKNRELESIRTVATFSLLIIAIVNLLLIAFAPEAVLIFAPTEYYEAIYVIPPVSMSVYFMYMYNLFAKFEFYFEKTKLISVATVIGAIINIILNYIFINKYGYIAAAYTTLICYFLYVLFHYVVMTKVCNQNLNRKNPYNIKELAIISCVFILLGFLFMLVYDNLIIRYIIIILILITCFLYKNRIKNMINSFMKDRN